MNWQVIIGQALGFLQRIADRLAPEGRMQKTVYFNNVAPGTILDVVRLTRPCNAFCASLDTGVVRVWFGSLPGLAGTKPFLWPPADLTFRPSDNPIYEPFTARADLAVTIAVDDPGDNTHCKGALHFMYY